MLTSFGMGWQGNMHALPPFNRRNYELLDQETDIARIKEGGRPPEWSHANIPVLSMCTRIPTSTSSAIMMLPFTDQGTTTV